MKNRFYDRGGQCRRFQAAVMACSALSRVDKFVIVLTTAVVRRHSGVRPHHETQQQ